MSILFNPTQSLARTLVSEGLALFKEALISNGLPSPFADEEELVTNFGTALNPSLCLSFYKKGGNLFPEASECLSYDEKLIKQELLAFHRFIGYGGNETTREHASKAVGEEGQNFRVDFLGEKTSVYVHLHHGVFPFVEFRSWESGLLDLNQLTEVATSNWFNKFDDQLNSLNYEEDRSPNLYRIGQLFIHVDPNMSPLLVRQYPNYNGQEPEITVEVFYQTGKPQTSSLIKGNLLNQRNLTIDLRSSGKHRTITYADCSTSEIM